MGRGTLVRRRRERQYEGGGRARIHPDADLPDRTAAPRGAPLRRPRERRAGARRRRSGRPYFFVRADAEAAVGRVARGRVHATDARAPSPASPSCASRSRLPGDVPPLRTRLGEAGVECLEADVRFAYRYLIDRGIRGALHRRRAVRAAPRRRPRLPQSRRSRRPTSPHAPRPLVRHRDEPRRPAALLDRAARAPAASASLIVARGPVAGAEVVPDERALLERFLAHVRAADPDVLTGWNVCDFDLAVLLARLPAGRASAARSGAPTTSSSSAATRASRASRARSSPAASCSTAWRSSAAPSSASTTTGSRRRRARSSGKREALRPRAPRRRDRGGVPRRPGAPRRLQPRGRAAGARDPRARRASSS